MMPQVQAALAHIEPLVNRIDAWVGEPTHNRVSAFFTDVSCRTNVPRRYVSTAFVLFVVLFLFFGLGQSLLSMVIGVIWPAYMSMKALESPTKDDDVQWLTYWIVFATFSVIEVFADVILYWLPFYYTAKIVFLLWLMHSSTRGAEVIYRSFLRVHFLNITGTVDAVISDVTGAGGFAAGAARLMAAANGNGTTSSTTTTATAIRVSGSSAVQRGTSVAPATDPSLIFGETTGHTD